VEEQTNLALAELTRTQRYIYSSLLLLALAFELSGNYWLSTTAKVARTLVAIVYIMRIQEPENSDRSGDTSFYCCFGLLWALVLATILAVLYLIFDREREHINLETIGNKTQ